MLKTINIVKIFVFLTPRLPEGIREFILVCLKVKIFISTVDR